MQTFTDMTVLDLNQVLYTSAQSPVFCSGFWPPPSASAMIFLPSTVDTVAFDGETALNLLPNYWTGLWFFTYYYLGCYIRVYQPKVRRAAALAAVALVALAFGFLNAKTGGEVNFSNGYTISYDHLGMAAMTTLLFLSVYQLECSVGVVCRAAKVIASVTMKMYLVSSVFDYKS